MGEWKNDKFDGNGTYTWADGRKYVGEWKNGKEHGNGTFTTAEDHDQNKEGETKSNQRNFFFFHRRKSYHQGHVH